MMLDAAGWVLLLAGAAGFVRSDLFGLHLTPMHGIINLLAGSAALYFAGAGRTQAARRGSLVLGAAQLALALTITLAPAVALQIFMHGPLPARGLAPDAALHLVLGLALLVEGFSGPRELA